MTISFSPPGAFNEREGGPPPASGGGRSLKNSDIRCLRGVLTATPEGRILAWRDPPQAGYSAPAGWRTRTDRRRTCMDMGRFAFIRTSCMTIAVALTAIVHPAWAQAPSPVEETMK